MKFVNSSIAHCKRTPDHVSRLQAKFAAVGAAFASLFNDAATAEGCQTGTQATLAAATRLLLRRGLLLVAHLGRALLVVTATLGGTVLSGGRTVGLSCMLVKGPGVIHLSSQSIRSSCTISQISLRRGISTIDVGYSRLCDNCSKRSIAQNKGAER